MNKSIDNNLATTGHSLKLPFSFGGSKEEDPEAFMENVREFVGAMRWTGEQSLVLTKHSLHSEARVWLDSQGEITSFEELGNKLITRFKAKNNMIIYITQLAEARRGNASWLFRSYETSGKKGWITTRCPSSYGSQSAPTRIHKQNYSK